MCVIEIKSEHSTLIVRKVDGKLRIEVSGKKFGNYIYLDKIQVEQLVEFVISPVDIKPI